jgi:diadenosine tetraphosphate (Ap4A) HIT family hydrolase
VRGQALCWQCNTNKGAGDATDFRAVRASHAIREAACPFCTLTPDRIVAENAVALAIRDGYPVTPLHTLVLPKRHVSDFFTLADSEVRALYRLAADVRRDIQRRDATVAGFNLGVNGGAVAGQTIAHCHLHVIPRRVGDVANPRGGVRATIPGRADYAPAPHGQPKDDSGETA